MEPNAATIDQGTTGGTRFRLRTLFIATATCAAAFAVMVRWPGGIIFLLTACVPGTWLIVGFGMTLMALERAPRWTTWPVRFALAFVVAVLIMGEALILIGTLSLVLLWLSGGL